MNRNVMAPPPPYKNRKDYQHAEQLAEDFADLLAPQSGAYYDVWLDGEKYMTAVKEVRLLFPSALQGCSSWCLEHMNPQLS